MWAGYDDSFTGRAAWDGVSHTARWHYVALVERCCRDYRWDGVLPFSVALRVSDVPDPQLDLIELETHGWVTILNDVVRLVHILEHIPPKGQRPDNLLPRKRKNQAEYRERRCDEGKHDRSCPKTCPERVTGNPDGNPGGHSGTGRDGQGKATTHLEQQLENPYENATKHRQTWGQS